MIKDKRRTLVFDAAQAARGNCHAVLIYGAPTGGKSTLAGELKARYEYEVIGLDDVYVKFIEVHYPRLYLKELGQGIQQHYHDFLEHWNNTGHLPGAVAKWIEHVGSLADTAVQEHDLVAVEGYLLEPALEAVKKRLLEANVSVTVVKVADGKYYIIEASVDQIRFSGFRP